MSRWLVRILATLGGLGVLLGAGLLTMLLWSDPVFLRSPETSPEALAAMGVRFDQPYPAEVKTFSLTDGTVLAAQYLPAEARTTIVYLHGILGASFLLNHSSGLLREAGPARVVALDLRGHGASGGAPGDTAYVGQYEDDLAEVVTQLRREFPGSRVILAGHSMGGGILLRYAERAGAPSVDGYLLFAPYLGWDAPTTRQTAPEPGDPNADAMKVHVPRVLGLAVLNAVGIQTFNGLRTTFFNLPAEFPLRSYSYRAMASAAPANFRRALGSVRAPLLVVVGSRDEAFVAEAYPEVIRAYTQGRTELIPDATHNGVLGDPRGMAVVAAWLGRVNPRP